MSKYIVLRDTREKNGWDFSSQDKCMAVKDWGLKTGDYTARGLEKSLVIERKASTGELAMNLGQKRKPFEAEMDAPPTDAGRGHGSPVPRDHDSVRLRSEGRRSVW